MREHISTDTSLKDALRSLCDLSVERAYDPYNEFDWPDTLPDDRLWMSRDLLSLHGTPFIDEFTEEQLWNLSKWELINFFSFNVHGIRDLMLHVLSCIHNTGYELTSEYFHHFLDEENRHMWFFAEFCKRYGGKIYFSQQMQFQSFSEEDIRAFIAFAQILISEQIGDFYNKRMMADETLHPIIRKINRVHHEDENRHIAMGLRVVRALHEKLAGKYPDEILERVESYLRRYMQFFVQSFYNPGIYRDAGLENSYELRNKLIDHPARREFHKKMLGNTLYFFRNQKIILEEVF